MAKREKKTVYAGVTREEMEEAMSKYATAEAKYCSLTARMDVEMTKIREKYADELARLDGEKEEAFDLLQAFAVENKTELFSKRKSLESVHGTIGFRTGTPKLKPAKGFTWASITNLLKEFLPDYIRTTEEPAKDKLLADREDELVATNLPRVGISVVQEETFYVEVKKEVQE